MSLPRDDLYRTEGPLFKYEKLQREHSIRLLRLHFGIWERPITCDLTTAELDGNDELTQSYEAIS
jgi:hypothetical protein